MKYLIIPILLLLFIITAISFYYSQKKGWSCNENKCEYVIGGNHSTIEKCKQVCNTLENQSLDIDLTNKKKVSFKEPLENNTPEKQEPEKQEPELEFSYTCNHQNYNCTKVLGKDSGEYTSLEACRMNCPQEYRYLPQSLLYFDTPRYYDHHSPRYRRPRRWRHIRRRHRPRSPRPRSPRPRSPRPPRGSPMRIRQSSTGIRRR